MIYRYLRRLSARRLSAGYAAVGLLACVLGLPLRTNAQIMPPSLRAYAGIDTLTLKKAAEEYAALAAAALSRKNHLEGQATALRSGGGIPAAITTLTAEARRLREKVASSQTRRSENSGQLIAFRQNEATQRADSTRLEANLADLRNRLAALPVPSDGIDPDELARRTLTTGIEALQAQLGDVSKRLTQTQSDIVTLTNTNTALQRQEATDVAEADAKDAVVAQLQANNIDTAVAGLQSEAQTLGAEAARYTRASEQERARAQDIAGRVRSGFMPVRDERDAAVFYNEPLDLSLGRSANVSLGTEGNGSVTAEIARVFAGPVRVLLSGVVANADEDTEDTEPDSSANAETPPEPDESDLRRFYAGGGNLVLSASYPALVIGGGRRFTAVVQLLGKWGLDLPGGGLNNALVSSTAMNLDIGPDAYFSWGLDKGDRLRAFGFARLGGVLGTDKFYDGVGTPHASFMYSQVVLGGEIRNTARIVFTRAYGPGPLDDDWRITVQLTPLASR